MRRLALAALLFLFFNSLFALTSTGRVRVEDEVLTLFQSESLALHGTTAVPQAVRSGLFYGRFDRHREPRAPYPPGHALAAVPWYLLSQLLAHLPGAAPDHDLIVGFALCLSSATFAALACALAFLVFLELDSSEGSALAAAVMMGFATPLFAYSAWFYSEPLSCALLIAAALILVHAGDNQSRALALGTVLGLALWIRPTNVVFAAVFIAAWWLGDRTRWRTALLICALVSLSGVLYLFRNQQLFGDPFEFGYPQMAENGRRLNSFQIPFLTGLYGFLLSPGKSVFLYAPTVFLGLAGLKSLWSKNRELALVCVGAPIASLLLFAKYSQWEGGYSYGPRYMVPGAVLLSLAAVMLFQGSPLSLWAKIVIATGTFVQFAGIAVSFLETEATGRYYDPHWNYRLSFFSLGEQLQLFAHYLVRSQPAPLGRGFDRWYIFLHTAGVPWTSLAIIAVPEVILLVISTVFLVRTLRSPSAGESPR